MRSLLLLQPHRATAAAAAAGEAILLLLLLLLLAALSLSLLSQPACLLLSSFAVFIGIKQPQWLSGICNCCLYSPRCPFGLRKAGTTADWVYRHLKPAATPGFLLKKAVLPLLSYCFSFWGINTAGESSNRRGRRSSRAS